MGLLVANYQFVKVPARSMHLDCSPGQELPETLQLMKKSTGSIHHGNGASYTFMTF